MHFYFVFETLETKGILYLSLLSKLIVLFIELSYPSNYRKYPIELYINPI